MRASKYIRWLFWGVKLALLAGTVAAAVRYGRPGEWEQIPLVALLLALALLGQWLSIEISGGGEIGAASIAIVLAMALLGPTPAVACGLVAMVLASLTRRLGAAAWVNNLSTFAVVPFAGGLTVRALAAAAGATHRQGFSQS